MRPFMKLFNPNGNGNAVGESVGPGAAGRATAPTDCPPGAPLGPALAPPASAGCRRSTAPSKVTVPLPADKEVERLLDVIAQSFEIIDVVQEQAAALERLQGQLNQSILAKSFRSELVPQDPNDESASVLVESIRAEREADGVWVKSGARRAWRRRWAESRANAD